MPDARGRVSPRISFQPCGGLDPSAKIQSVDGHRLWLSAAPPIVKPPSRMAPGAVRLEIIHPMTNQPLRRSVRIIRWRLALIAVPLLLVAAADPLETVGKAATDWVKVRAETARLEAESGAQRRILESMADAYAERAKTTEDQRDALRARTAELRGSISQLEAENKAAAAAWEVTAAQVKTLAVDVVRLRPSLPPRLATALELPYHSLADPELPVAERMQLVMSVLNRCTQFNRAITCEEEVVTVAAGEPPRLLEVIYWGLSHGYALDRRAGKAWFGAPDAAGWRWEPLPDGAAAVARLVAVAQGKAEPEFVAVPARVRSRAGEAQR